MISWKCNFGGQHRFYLKKSLNLVTKVMTVIACLKSNIDLKSHSENSKKTRVAYLDVIDK